MGDRNSLAVEAIELQLGLVSGWLELDFTREDGSSGKWWARTTNGQLREHHAMALQRDHELRTSLARVARWGFPAGHVPVLWVRTEGSAQAKRLANMRPLPTLVLRAGESSRRLAMWALNAPVPFDLADDYNRRLAHRCGAAKKHADPDRFSFVLPGCLERHGRTRPVRWECTRLTTGTYTADQLAAHLRRPDPKAWQNK